MTESRTEIRHAGLALCVAATLLVAACGRDNPETHLAKAKELSAKKDHRGAIIELKNTLQANPQLAEARYLLGKTLLEQGDPKNAEIELKKALDLKFDADQVTPPLVKSQFLQGQADTIIKTYATRKLKSPAANAELQTLVGYAQFSRGKTDEALLSFAAAEQYIPGYPNAVLGEARIKASREDMSGATALVDQVLAKAPAQTEGLMLKGDLDRAQGNIKDAIARYESAVKEQPRNFSANLSLAGAYVAAGQLELAQKRVEELKKISPRHPNVNYLDALLAFGKKDYPKANDAIQLTITAQPNNGQARLLAGAIATELNQPAQAEQHLREVLKQAPGHLYARKLLASLYLRQRQPQKADEILQPALAAAPDDAALIGLAGEVALLKGDLDAASKNFERAAKLNPADGRIRTQSAVLQFAKGDAARGFAELEEASKAAPANSTPDIALVLAHLRLNEYDKALASWKTLEKRQPNNPLTYNLRAAIDLGKNDPASARKALEHALELQPNFFPAAANLASLDLKENKIDDAKKRYTTLIAKDPRNVQAQLALAQLEQNTGARKEDVLARLKEARRSNPGSEQAVMALASHFVNNNDPKQALATAQQALAGSANNPRYLDLVGQLQLRTGSADQAISTYRQLTTLNPELSEYQIKLGNAQLAAGHGEEALQSFSKVLKQGSQSAGAQAAIVTTLLRAGKNDDAAKILADLRQRAPNSAPLTELDGDVKFAAQKYADAASLFRKALAQSPSPNLVVKSHRALALAGKKAEADTVLSDWIRKNPKDTSIRLYDADLALRAGDFARASQQYRALLEVQPNDPIFLNNLAWALWQQKDPQALAIAEKAYAASSNNAAVSDTLGWMLVEQGQTKRGVELLEKASARAPDSRDISLHLAKAFIKDGRKEAARTTLQTLVQKAPDSAEGKESKALLASL